MVSFIGVPRLFSFLCSRFECIGTECVRTEQQTHLKTVIIQTLPMPCAVSHCYCIHASHFYLDDYDANSTIIALIDLLLENTNIIECFWFVCDIGFCSIHLSTIVRTWIINVMRKFVFNYDLKMEFFRFLFQKLQIISKLNDFVWFHDLEFKFLALIKSIG